MTQPSHQPFLQRAIDLALEASRSGDGGPFGCVVVLNGEIIGEGHNMVTLNNDPTAHAEIMAIRAACKRLNSFQLTGCEIYTSCEPCPMCLGAIYWSRASRVVFASTRLDAAAADFDDDFIYREINTAYPERKIPFLHHPLPDALAVFHSWKANSSRKHY